MPNVLLDNSLYLMRLSMLKCHMHKCDTDSFFSLISNKHQWCFIIDNRMVSLQKRCTSLLVTDTECSKHCIFRSSSNNLLVFFWSTKCALLGLIEKDLPPQCACFPITHTFLSKSASEMLQLSPIIRWYWVEGVVEMDD